MATKKFTLTVGNLHLVIYQGGPTIYHIEASPDDGCFTEDQFPRFTVSIYRDLVQFEPYPEFPSKASRECNHL